MATAKPYYISPPYAFVAFPNQNSVPFREFYGIPEVHTVIRGSLRYQGCPEFIQSLVSLGLPSADEKNWLKDGLSWAQALQKAIGATEFNER